YFFTVILGALRQAGRLRVWLLLLGYYAVYGIVLLAHYDFTSPLFYPVISWWTALPLFPNAAARATAFTHYPNHLVLLVDYYGWAKLALGVLFEGLMLGLLVRWLAPAASSRNETAQWPSLAGRWFHLALGWTILNGLMLLAALELPQWFAPLLGGPRRALAFNLTVIPFVYTLLLALLFQMVPLISLRGQNVFSAIGQSLKAFLHRPMTTFLLAAIVIAGPFLFATMAGYASFIVQRFRPELIVWLLGFGLVAEMFAAFLWMAMANRLMQDTY
ncbi:MAG: hypothetical protein D6800_01705, partial [Candidatus Zixiibacteriota bacterium]